MHFRLQQFGTSSSIYCILVHNFSSLSAGGLWNIFKYLSIQILSSNSEDRFWEQLLRENSAFTMFVCVHVSGGVKILEIFGWGVSQYEWIFHFFTPTHSFRHVFLNHFGLLDFYFSFSVFLSCNFPSTENINKRSLAVKTFRESLCNNDSVILIWIDVKDLNGCLGKMLSW